jgi:hypothetical protein
LWASASLVSLPGTTVFVGFGVPGQYAWHDGFVGFGVAGQMARRMVVAAFYRLAVERSAAAEMASDRQRVR